jgi:hypothetical protein
MNKFHLTPDMMERAYDYLRETPPFKAWRMPESDDLDFHVLATPRIHGDCGYDKGRVFIRLSTAMVGCTLNLIATMAHEMIHAEQWRRKVKARNDHDAFFRRAADRACSWHGFDRKTF